jgi:hypothetical protein
MQQALTIALATTEAIRQEKASEDFLAKAPDEHVEQAHGLRTDAQQNIFSKKASVKPRKGPEVRCYECDDRGHYARECPTRSRRESNPRDPPRNEEPSERLELYPDNENRRASSFFLSASEMAADFRTASLRVSHGKPTVRVKIRGVNREFIVDSGSGVSLIKPGICYGQVRPSRTTHRTE